MASSTHPTTVSSKTSFSQNEVVGIVKRVIGTVTVVDRNGVTHELKVGDMVFFQDTIVTSETGAVEIDLVNGNTIDMGRSDSVMIGDDILAPQENAAMNAEQLREAILRGEDPSKAGAPTAAGGASSEGGHSFVYIEQNAARAEVTSGLDMSGAAIAGTTDEYQGADELPVDAADPDVPDTPDTPDAPYVPIEPLDSAPVAIDDAISVAEDTPFSGSLAANDTPSANGGNTWAKATDPAQGTVTVNADGSFTYTPNAGAAGADSFTYTLTDVDGDTSTGTVTVTIAADSQPQAGTAQALTVNESGLDTGSQSATGSVTVNFGNDTPANLAGAFALQATGLDNKLQTLDGQYVTFASTSAGGLVGTVTVNGNAIDVMRIDVTGATGTGTVTYGYTVTLLQPLTHADGQGANSLTLSGIGFLVTDADNSSTAGSFDLTIVDDLPGVKAESQSVAEGATLQDQFDFEGCVDGASVTHVNGIALIFDQTVGTETGWSQQIDLGNGTIQVQADGHYRFTAGATASSQFAAAVMATVTVQDGDGDTASEFIRFAVTDANAPTAGATQASVDEAMLVGGTTGSVTGTLTHQIGGDGYGSVGFANLNGKTGTAGSETVTYSWANDTLTATGPRGVLFEIGVTPTTGEYTLSLKDNVLCDADKVALSLEYMVTDADGSTAPGTLAITVTDAASSAVSTIIEVTEGTPKTFSVFDDKAFGADGASANDSVKFAQGVNGIVTYDANTKEFTYTPKDADWTGPDSFTYTLTDADGDQSTGTVTLNVVNVNDDPTALADTASAIEDVMLTVAATSGVLVNDTDVDTGDTKTVSGVAFGTTTGTVGSGLAGTYGTLTLNADGSYTYLADKAAAQALGTGQKATEVFSYTMRDTAGATSTATITFTIHGTNDIATVSSVTQALTEGDTAAAISTSGILTITDADSGEAHSVAQTATAGAYGTFTIDTDGAWTYTASSAHDELTAGQVVTDVFTVTSQDGTASGTVTITITGTNDIATVSSFTQVLTEGDTAAAISTSGTLTITDADSGEAHSVAQTATAGAYGTFTIDTDGAWTYTASSAHDELTAGQVVTDVFTVTSQDGTASGTVTITITGTNDIATVSSFTQVLTEGDTAAAISTSGTLTITDADSGEAHSVAQTATAGAYGTFAIDANGAWTYTANGAHDELTAGQVVTDVFTVMSQDGTGSGTVTITITGTNDAATISGTSAGAVTEDTNVVNNSLSTGGKLSVSDADQGQSVFQVQSDAAGAKGYGVFSITAAGDWTYTADNSQAAVQQLGAGQMLTDTIVVTSADGSATQTITVTIHGTNDTATISGTSTGSVTEDVSVSDTGYLSTSGTLRVSTVDQGQAVFQVQTGVAGANGYGVFSINAAGDWIYAADNSQAAVQQLGAGQMLTDSIVVTSADGSASQTITVTIHGTNDTATVSSDSRALTEGDTAAAISTSGTLTITDADSGEAHSVAQTATAGAYGTFTIDTDGAWTYTASSAHDELTAGQVVTDVFTVTSQDGTASGTVTITITGTNDAATVSSFTQILTEGDTAAAISTSGTLTITDADSGEAHSVAQTATAGAYGTFTIDTDGAWTYTASSAHDELTAGQVVTESFTVTSQDGTGIGTVTITITGTDDAAVLSSATVPLSETDAPLATNGQLTITDVDSAASFVAQTDTQGTYGKFSIDDTGAWTYKADSAYDNLQAGDTISDIFEVSSADGTKTSVTVTINGTNDAPVAHDDSLSTSKNQALNIDTAIKAILLSNDTDVDSTTLSFTGMGGASHGTVTTRFNGTSVDYIYTPDKDFTGTDVLNYNVSDGHGGVAVGTLIITVTNDTATVSSDSRALTEGDTAAAISTSGTLIITDADSGEAHSVAQTATAGAYGTFAIDTNGAWTYTASSAHDELTAGQVVTESFTVMSQDGTGSGTVTITITGTNDIATISGTSAGAVTEDTNVVNNSLSTGGTLSVSDADQGQSVFQAQSDVTGAKGYGVFSITAAGNWSYTADNRQTAVQQLGAGQSLTDSIVVTSADGSASQTITVTIHGTNDTATISGTSTGSVTEDVGLSDTGYLSTGGKLSVSHADQGQSVFQVQSNVTGANGYGVFSINAAGNWSYTAANSQAAVQQLGVGETLTDSIVVTSADGSASQTITVTIHGTNDAPTTKTVTLSSIVEDSGIRIITEAELLANAEDIDGDTLDVTNLVLNTGMGKLADNGDGTWSYTPDLNENISASFRYTISDGTESVTGHALMDIIPENDAPVNNMPAAINATRGIAQAITNLWVTDVDNNLESTQLSVQYGKLNVTASGNAIITGNDSGTLTISGNKADINATLASLTYLSTVSYPSSDTLSVTSTDTDGLFDTDSVDITVDFTPQVGPTQDLTIDEANLVDPANTDLLTVRGTVAVNFGNDVPTINAHKSLVLKSTGLDNQLKTLDGQDVSFAVTTDGQLIGTVDGGATQVLRVELPRIDPSDTDNDNENDTLTYTYKATLLQPLKHADGQGENSVTLSDITFEVTDKDGDVRSGSFNVTIVDDTPSMTVVTGTDNVILDTQDAQASTATPDTRQSAAHFSGMFSVTSAGGADGAQSPSLNYALGLTVASGTDSGLASNGKTIYLHLMNDGAIIGSTSSSSASAVSGAVFMISVEAGTGVVTLTQYGPIDHDVTQQTGTYSDTHQFLADGLVQLTATGTVTDKDGDIASHSQTVDLGGNIRFDDDGPTATPGAASLDDDGVSGGASASTIGDQADANSDGDNSEATFTGTLAHTFGADGAGSVDFSLMDGTTATVGTATVAYSWSSNTGTLTATVLGGVRNNLVLFDIKVVPTTGLYNYTLTQHMSVMHDADDTNPNTENDAVSVLTYRVTDADGSTADSTLTVTFDDDMPVAVDRDFGSVLEGSAETTLSTVAAFLAANVQGGADGYQDGSFTLMNGSSAVTTLTGSLGGTLRIENGNMLYTPPASVDQKNAATESFFFQVKDQDGDADTGVIQVTIADGAAPVLTAAAVTVDEDGLAYGNAGDSYGSSGDVAGEATKITGTLSATLGSDPLATNKPFAFTGVNNLDGLQTSDGKPVTLSTLTVSPDGSPIQFYTGMADGKVVFEVTLNQQTGDWSYEQKLPVRHATANAEDDVTISFGVRATDRDGTSGASTLTITINDDAPTTTQESLSIDEGKSVDGKFDFEGGADGATLTHIGGKKLSFGTDGWSQEIDLKYAKILAKADGTYMLTANDNTGTSIGTSFTITDADGDQVVDGLNIVITDRNKPTANPSSAWVDDDGLSGGAAASTAGDQADTDSDGDNDEATFTDMLPHTFGADGAGSVDFSLMDKTRATVGTETVEYSWSSDTLTATIVGGVRDSQVLFDIKVVPSSGSYGYTLTQHIPVMHEPGTNTENDAVSELTYRVTDADGSTADSTLTVTFDDDMPAVVSNTSASVYEGKPTSGQFDFQPGADGASVTHLNGETLTFTNGWSQEVTLRNGQGTILGTIQVQADGHYRFTANASTSGNTVSATYTVTDGDGDTATGNIAITIADANSPTATPTTASDKADDDALTNGNDGGIGDVNGSATVIGQLLFNYGNDGQGTTGGVRFADGSTTLGTEQITLKWDSTTGTLSGTATRDSVEVEVFTITVDASGGYKFTLRQPVMHASGNNENDAKLDLTYVVTDADSTSASSTLTITINDDTPSVVVNTGTGTVVLDTQNAQASITSPDTSQSGANFSGMFSLTSSGGADGAPSPSLSYALSLAVAPGTASGLTSGGQTIYLYLINDEIIGSTSSTELLAVNNAVFLIAVDGTGVVTVFQSRSIDNIVTQQFLGNNLVNLVVTGTSTDKDDDTVSASQTLDLGSHIRFDDSRPNVTVVGTTQELIVDETVRNLPASANFSGAFAIEYGADGASATQPVTYELWIKESASASGLVDTETGEAVVLSLANNGAIEGRTKNSNSRVFTLEIDKDGEVTLTQNRSVKHADAADPNDTTTLSAGSVVLAVTAMDKNGSTTSNFVDISKNLVFTDDGPTVDVSIITKDVVLNTQDADTVGTATDEAETTANFSGMFSWTSAGGADGEASASLTYRLHVVTDGVDSGLTSGGKKIYLSEISGSIYGKTDDGSLVFWIAHNNDGKVVLKQFQQLDHPTVQTDSYSTLGAGLVTLEASATVTDKDGDSVKDSATLDLGGYIRFDDDMPAVVSNTSASVYEGEQISGQFDFQPGADGASVTHLNGETLTFTNGWSQVVTLGNGLGTIQLQADGHYRFTANASTSGNTVSANYTVTDGDGDTATGNIAIAIADANSPTANPTTASDKADDDALVNGNDGGIGDANGLKTIEGTLSFGYGNDGQGTTGGIRFADGSTTLGTEQITLKWDSTTGTLSGTATRDSVEVEVFTITVGASGGYKFTLRQPVMHASGNNENDATLDLTYVVTDADSTSASSTLTITINDDTPSVVVNMGTGTVVLDTQNAQASVTSPDTSQSGANFSGMFSLTSAGGADGAPSPSLNYSLSLAQATASSDTGLDSGLTHNGQTIYLYLINDEIIGSTSSTELLAVNNAVFLIAVDGTGVVTVFQSRSIDNNVTQQFLGDNLVNLVVTGTSTDKDDDTVSASQTLDLGSHIRFDDSRPEVKVVGTSQELIVDETVSDSQASANFSGAFVIEYGADGASATQSVTYELGIMKTASGLVDTGTGANVVLSLANNGVIFGQTDDSNRYTVFTVEVDKDGEVTLTQNRSVKHDDASDPDDTTTLSTGSVKLVVTAMDKNGSTASNFVDISKNLVFTDDGPTIDVSIATKDVVLNTQDADTVDTVTNNVVQTVTDKAETASNFSGMFSLTSSGGADGEASLPTMTYRLHAASDGVKSGLTSGDKDIYLYEAYGSVYGSTHALKPDSWLDDGSLVFWIGTTNDGKVGLMQFQQLDHPTIQTDSYSSDQITLGSNLVRLEATATITDKDGDSATDVETLYIGGYIRFTDDGPSLTADASMLPTITVDETSLDAAATADFSTVFKASYGADGAAATSAMAYTLSSDPKTTDSGLVDAKTGESIVLSLNATTGMIEGRTITGNNLVFTVAVDATGIVTLDQQRAVQQVDDTATLWDGAIKLTATAKDGDGDQATVSVDIGEQLIFMDDVPSAVSTIIEVTEGTPKTFSVFDDKAFGADGASANDSVQFTQGANGGVTYDANTKQFTYTPKDADVTGQDSFTYTLTDADGDKSTGTVTLNVVNINDDPVISAADLTGNVIEDVNVDTSGYISTTGTITFDDADLDDIHSRTISPAISNTLGGTLKADVTTLAAGNGPGTVTWTYTVDNAATQYLAAGQPVTESFTVTIDDGHGGTASRIITVTITGTNDIATISGTSTGAVTEDTGLVNNFLSTGGTLSVSDADQGQSVFVPQTGALGANGYGTFSINAVGEWSYTADNSQAAVQQLGAGQTLTDTIVVMSADGSDSQTITVTINGTNDAAVLSSDTVTLVETNAALTTSGKLTISDIDSAASFDPQTNTSGQYGTFSIDTTGAWTYKADSAYDELQVGDTKSDIFEVTSADGTKTSVTVSITGSNDAPVNDTPASIIATENIAQAIALSVSDVDDSNVSTVLSVKHGTLSVTAPVNVATITGNNSGTLTISGSQDDINATLKTLTYQGDQDYNGKDTLTVTTTDAGGLSATDTVPIEVTADPKPDVRTPQDLTVNENGLDTSVQSATGSVSVHFSSDIPTTDLKGSVALKYTASLDGQLTTVDGQPVSFALEGNDLVGKAGSTEVVRIKIVDAAAVVGSTTGEVSYTYSVTLAEPVKHADGQGANSTILSGITFQATDKDGDTQNGSFSVTIIDDVPQAMDDAISVKENDPSMTFSPLDNDEAGVDGLDKVTVNNGAKGTVSYDQATGQFTYTRNAGASGDDSFTYTISDRDGDTSTATVSVSIAADSTPLVGATVDLTIDEDKLVNAATDPESVIARGSVKVTYGADDIPGDKAFKLQLTGLDTQLQTLDGQYVTFRSTTTLSQEIIGTVNNGATEVLRIAVYQENLDGSDSKIYRYKAQLSQPVMQANGQGENSITLSNIHFEVTDKDGSIGTGSFDVTIIDDVASANNASQSVAEGDTATGTFDFVPGADGATVTHVNGVELTFDQTVGTETGWSQVVTLGNGTIQVKADGSYVFTADNSVTGTEVVPTTFTVQDGDGDVATGTLTLTVTPVDDLLIAGDDSFTLQEDQSNFTGTLTGGDTGGVSWALDTVPAHGTVTVNTDGSFSYTPNANYSGTDSFTYKVTDDDNDFAIATVSLTITAVADKPLLSVNKVIASTNFQEPAAGDPTFAYSQTYEVIDLNGGIWRTTNDDGVVGDDDSDGKNYIEIGSMQRYLGQGYDNSNFVLDLERQYDTSPNLYADVTTKLNTTYRLELYYSPRPDALDNSVAEVYWGGNLVATLNSSIAGFQYYSFDLPQTTGTLTRLEFKATDNNSRGPLLDNISLFEPSTDSNIVVTGTEDTAISLTIAAALTDIDGSESLSIRIDGVPSGAQLSTGTYVTNSDGTTTWTLTASQLSGLTLTPPANFNGTINLTVTATATESSNLDQASTSINVAVTVTPINDKPTANPDTYEMSEGGSLTVTAANGVLKNDYDVDSTISGVNVYKGTQHGTLSMNSSDGSFTYTLKQGEENYHGNDYFTYRVSDGKLESDLVTVTLVIHPVNDAPVAHDDTADASKNTPLEISAATLLSNDTDVDTNDTKTIISVQNAVDCTVSLGTDTSGNAVVMFTPATDFTGQAFFTYTVADSSGTTSTATVTVTVDDTTAIIVINEVPGAADDSLDTKEDIALTISPDDLLANDTDADNDVLNIISVQDGIGGTVEQSNGKIVFTPNSNFHGDASFTYTVSDGNGGTSTATATVAIAAVADAPDLAITGDSVYVTDFQIGSETYSQDILASALGGLIWGTGNQNGRIEVATEKYYFPNMEASTNKVIDLARTANDLGNLYSDVATKNGQTYHLEFDYSARLGHLADGSEIGVYWDGDLVMTLNNSVAGFATYSVDLMADHDGYTRLEFRVKNSSNYGGLLDDISFTTLDVPAQNGLTVPEDQAIVLDMSAVLGDPDGSEKGSLTITGLAAGMTSSVGTINGNGSLTLDSTDLANLTTLTLTPAPNYNGTFNAVFTYTATEESNGDKASTTVVVPVTITPVNDAAVAVADSYSISNLNTPLVVGKELGLLVNDTDVENDSLSALIAGGPSHGTLGLNADGSFTYTPGSTFSNTDSFTYKVYDGTVSSATATVTLTFNDLVSTTSTDQQDIDDAFGSGGESGGGNIASIPNTGSYSSGSNSLETLLTPNSTPEHV